MAPPQQPDAANSIRIRRVEAWAFRAAIDNPVETSFGVMRDRPAVFVRVEDQDGAVGFGEIWCNFPSCGAEHRVRLATEELGPLLTCQNFDDPNDAFDALTRKTRIRVLQSGETGPYRQAIAGLDIALWDMWARRVGKRLCDVLNPEASKSVPAYASGIVATKADELVSLRRAEGYRAYKVKVGFDRAADFEALAGLHGSLDEKERLFCDANQAWGVDEAITFSRGAAGFGLDWLEEPLAADAPAGDWEKLAREGSIPLAAGENMADGEFGPAMKGSAFSFIQPDVAKWGGISKCFPLARDILSVGKTYCPHFLGGGIGLAASAHLLASAGGPGLLEVDANPNPLREAFSYGEMTNGVMTLPDMNGLGIKEIPSNLMEFATLHGEWTA